MPLWGNLGIPSKTGIYPFPGKCSILAYTLPPTYLKPL